MNKNGDIQKLSENELEAVSGGTTAFYRAAVDLMNGVYGSGDAARQAANAGYDPILVQRIINGMLLND